MVSPDSLQLVERSNDGIIIIQDGLLKFGNSKILRMTGYELKEALERPFIDFVDPEYAGIVIEHYRNRIAGKEVPDRYEIGILTKDGAVIPVEINSSVIDFDSKQAIMAVVRDISDRKEFEEELHRNYQVQFIINQLLNTSFKNISFQEKLEEIIDHIISIPWLPITRRAAIFTVDKEREMLLMKVHRGRSESEVELCSRIPFGKCVCGRAARSGRIEFAGKIDERHDILYEGINEHGHYCVPVISSSREVVGLFNIQLEAGHEVDEKKMEFLGSIANVIAGTIERDQAAGEIENLSRFPSENPFPILRVTKTGTIIYANKASGESFGDWSCKTGRCLPREFNSKIRDVFEIGSVKQFEIDHGERIYSFEAIPVVDKDYVNLYGHDITESRKREDEINKLLSAIEQSADILFITCREGNIEYVNPAFEEVTGHTKIEALGKTPRILQSGMMSNDYYRKVWGTIIAGNVIKAEVVNRRKNGEIWHYDQTITPLIDSNGEITHFISTGKDVSERKRLERDRDNLYEDLKKAYTELKEAQAKLIQSEKLAGMGTMAAGVAHEINNPLQVIIGMAEMIQEGEELAQVREDTREILQASERIRHITENLTRYSRNVKTIERKPINLNDVIERSIGMARFSSEFRQIEVTKELDEIPDITANFGEMQQVFINLLTNAAQAMADEGTLTIGTASNSNRITVLVKDTGEGIPEENLEKIFDPFFTTKEAGKGTGLGLHVIRQIVEKHGGKIEVKSEVDRGTSFTLLFPIERKDYQPNEKAPGGQPPMGKDFFG